MLDEHALSQNHRVANLVDQEGGLKLTSLVSNNYNDAKIESINGYLTGLPTNEEEEKKKCWIVTMIALILAIIALIAAIVSIIILIPTLTKDVNNEYKLATAITSNESNIENYYIYENITKYYKSDCECPTNTYGVLNAGKTYKVGDYYGWKYSKNYPDLYPLPDLHVSIGDKVLFTTKEKTSDDLWLVTEDVYNSCNWSDTTNLRYLANNQQIRGDCDDKPWLQCGYEFLAQQWHIDNYGIYIFILVV